MQCPNCNHVAPEDEFGDPAKCPACGVYYAKALANQRRLAEAAKATEMPSEVEPPPVIGKLKRGLAGARQAVEEGRAERAAAESFVKARLDPSLAQPVVVVDLRMNFWSMVWFMVKWAIASIPALIILFILLWVAVGFFLGLSGSLSGPPRL